MDLINHRKSRMESSTFWIKERKIDIIDIKHFTVYIVEQITLKERKLYI